MTPVRQGRADTVKDASTGGSRWPWLVLLASFLMTVLVSAVVYFNIEQRDAVRFNGLAESTRDHIEARLATYLSVLQATSALHAASGNRLTRETFHAYVAHLDLRKQYPGIHGIGFAQRIRPSTRADLLRHGRESFEDFHIWPEQGSANTTAIMYLEPLDQRNRAAIGFDMFSEPVRRAAMRRAWRTGEPALSGRVLLKQETTSPRQAGFLLYVPVYMDDVVPRTEAARMSRLDGFVYGAFRTDDLFRGLFGSEAQARIAFRVFDEEVAPEALLHDSVASGAARAARPSFVRNNEVLHVAGRRWVLQFATQPAFERQRLTGLAHGLFLGGIGISLILFFLARSRARAWARSEQAERSGRFLLELEDTLRTIAEPDQVVATSARLLVEELSVQRCSYAEILEDEDSFVLIGGHAVGVPNAVGQYALSQFGATTLEELRAQRSHVIEDADRDARLCQAERNALHEQHIRAAVSVPLHKKGRLSAALAVHQHTPRRWSPDEVELVKSVASRCWESLERVRAEKTLRESEERFRNMADHAPVMLWMTDASGAGTYLNRPFFEFSGVTEGTDVALAWLSTVHPEDKEATWSAFAKAHRERRLVRAEFRLRRRDGRYRWVLAAAAPRIDATGSYLGYIGSIIDITDRKEVEEQREALLQQAEAAVRTRDAFLSIASHELKTPITALTFQCANIRTITHGAELISAAAVDKRLEAMNRQTSRLTSLVEELLDVSRIASGHLHVRAETLDLAGLVRDEVARLTTMLQRAGCAVEVKAPTTLEACVDPVRTQQVLDNLLQNAGRYGAGNPVEVTLETTPGKVHLIVRDHGIGIAPEDHSRIFERFERAVSPKHYGGLGLGLWITRQIVSLMGGTICVASALGEGATFTVTIPAKPVERVSRGLGPRGSVPLA